MGMALSTRCTGCPVDGLTDYGHYSNGTELSKGMEG